MFPVMTACRKAGTKARGTGISPAVAQRSFTLAARTLGQLSAIALTLGVGASTCWGGLVASWTNSQLNGTGSSIAASTGTGSITRGSGVSRTNTSNVHATTGWPNTEGSAPTFGNDYIELTADTTGHSNLRLNFDYDRSGSTARPEDLSLYYWNGSAWIEIVQLAVTTTDKVENRDLSAITYLNNNPSARFRFHGWDGNDSGGSLRLWDISLGSNAAPVVTVPGSQNATEDVSKAISGVSVADADAGTNDIDVTLTTTNGIATLGSVTGMSLQAGANGSAFMRYRGTQAELTAALGTLSFLGSANFFGPASITVLANDLGWSGGASQTDTEVVNITVANVLEPIALTAPAGPLSVNEDTNLALTGISVSAIDVGTNPVQLQLSAAAGTLTFTSMTGLTTVAGANGSSTITVQGTVANLNARLGSSNLRFQGASNASGAVLITLVANDLGNTGNAALTDQKSFTVNVAAVNDAPEVTAPADNTAVEDTPEILTVTVTDADAGSNPIQIRVQSVQGIATLASTTGLTFTIGANGTADMTFTGTLTNIAAALNNFTWTPNANANGTGFSLTVTANDLGNTGGSALSDSDQVVFTSVSAVNDAPVVTNPGPQNATEDVSLAIGGVSVSDADAGANDMEVSLTTSNGTATLGSVAGMSLQAGANGSAFMRYRGTQAELTASLATLSFLGTSNFSGSASITVFANDRGFSGGASQNDTEIISIAVAAVLEPITLTAPAGPLTVAEDTDLALAGISVSANDVGTNVIRLTLTADTGTLTFSSTTGLTVVSGANGSSSFTVQGTVANINARLGSNNLEYRGASNASGAALVTLLANDLGNTGNAALTDQKSFTVNVTAVNDAPVVTGTFLVSADEDTTEVLTVTVNDVDAGSNPIQVRIDSDRGFAVLATTANLTFTAGANGTDDMTFTGTLPDITAALLNFTWTPAANLNGFLGGFGLNVTVNDLGNTGGPAQSDSHQTYVYYVAPQNDAPTLALPVDLVEAVEDEPVAFGGPGVADVDATAANLMDVTLTASNGTLTLGSTTGLAFQNATTNASANMTIRGTKANLNAAMLSLTYEPVPNFFGTDQISVLVNDRGNTGDGGAKTAADTIDVNVAAVNDGPVLAGLPATLSGDEDTTLALPAVSAGDIDADLVDVTLQATSGTLTVELGASTLVDGENGTSFVVVRGSVGDVNAALATAFYLGDADVTGTDTISLLVDDGGSSGTGGALTDAGIIDVTLNPVNDAPRIQTPGTFIVRKETDLALPGFVVTDQDEGTTWVQVSLSAEHGKLTLDVTDGLTFLDVQLSIGGHTLVFEGAIDDVNAALASLQYRGDDGYYGGDTITIVADDLGYAGGSGGPMSSNASVPFTVDVPVTLSGFAID